MSELEEILSHTNRDGGCLRWTRGHTGRGYGAVRHGGRQQLVHRVVWELSRGPVPNGLVIDHVSDRGCVHRDCIEISHLEPVTYDENNARCPVNPTTVNRFKVACSRGHELPEPGKSGWRRCEACKREQIPCASCGTFVSRSNMARHVAEKHRGDSDA